MPAAAWPQKCGSPPPCPAHLRPARRRFPWAARRGPRRAEFARPAPGPSRPRKFPGLPGRPPIAESSRFYCHLLRAEFAIRFRKRQRIFPDTGLSAVFSFPLCGLWCDSEASQEAAAALFRPASLPDTPTHRGGFMSSSVVARTSQPFKWWQSVGILVGFCLLVYGAFAGWQFVRVSNELGILKNANAAVRQKAAEALGRSESRRAVEPLIAALNDPDFGVQASAATALGEIKDQRAVEPLMATIKDAVKYGQATKGPDDVYSITDQQRSRLDVAQKAADALGNIGAPSLDVLMAAFKDKDLNGYAAPGLVKMGAPAVDSLVVAMHVADADVRWEATNALGEIKDPRAVPALLEALQVKDIQWHAALALGKIKDARSVEPLIAALQNKDRSEERRVGAAG